MYNNENSRLWYLLARRTAKEILPEEKTELDKLLQQYPYASFSDEVIQQRWANKNMNYSQADILSLLEKHKKRLRQAETNNAFPANNALPSVKPIEGKTKILSLVLRYGSIAAAIVFAVFLGYRKWSGTNSGDQENNIHYGEQLVTQMGSRSEMVLPDGSTVWLNAGSRLDYPKQFTGNSRDVQLQGEAYFEVTKDTDKPFFVHTKSFNIKVLGTEFNVRAYPDEDSAVTALVHGSVEIITGGANKKSILLRPNEKMTLPMNTGSEDGPAIKKSTPADGGVPVRPMSLIEDSVQVETAWVNNKLAFRKTPLVDVALLLEKWFGVEIRFKNEDKKALRFTGVYNGEQLEEILLSLEATGSFRYFKDKEGIIWIE